MKTDEVKEMIMQLRGIRDTCPRCTGLGKYSYRDINTWKGGKIRSVEEGCAVTRDVCDLCWGSGDKNIIWPSHKEFYEMKGKS